MYHMAKHDSDSDKIGTISGVIMRGIQASIPGTSRTEIGGFKLTTKDANEYEQDIRAALERNMDFLSSLYDIVAEIKHYSTEEYWTGPGQ